MGIAFDSVILIAWRQEAIEMLYIGEAEGGEDNEG